MELGYCHHWTLNGGYIIVNGNYFITTIPKFRGYSAIRPTFGPTLLVQYLLRLFFHPSEATFGIQLIKSNVGILGPPVRDMTPPIKGNFGKTILICDGNCMESNGHCYKSDLESISRCQYLCQVDHQKQTSRGKGMITSKLE